MNTIDDDPRLDGTEAQRCDLLAVLRKWLIERLRARDLGEQESYSVGVCQKCSYRTLWSGGMEGERFHVCAPCKAQQFHNFYSFDLGER